MVNENKLVQNPLTSKVGAISVGIVDGEIVADLDYAKDSNAEVDLNLVLDEKFEILEIQGTAEGKPFSKDNLDSLSAKGQYRQIPRYAGQSRSPADHREAPPQSRPASSGPDCRK